MGCKLPFPISPRALVHGLFSALTALLPPFFAASSKSPRSKTPPHPCCLAVKACIDYGAPSVDTAKSWQVAQ